MIDIEEIRKLAAQGLYRAEIARRLGITRATVGRRADRAGLVIACEPERDRYARLCALAETGRAARARKMSINVPKWVPPIWRDEYREMGAQYGEELAASKIRQWKREMQA